MTATPTLLLRRPLSRPAAPTTTPTRRQYSSAETPPPPQQQPPRIRRLATPQPTRIRHLPTSQTIRHLPSGTPPPPLIRHHSARAPTNKPISTALKHRAVKPALIADIPPTWHLTNDGTGIWRRYTFPTVEAAQGFCAAVVETAGVLRHHPEWAGWGRRVYVLWTTHVPRGLGGVDVECARECERVAVDRFGAGKVGENKEEGVSFVWRGRMAPEWFGGGKSKFGEVWGFVEGRAWEGREGFWPVWSNVYNRACVSQARFKEVVGEGGAVVGVDGEPCGGGQDEEVRELVWKKQSQSTKPQDESGDKVEKLLGEVTWAWPKPPDAPRSIRG